MSIKKINTSERNMIKFITFIFWLGIICRFIYVVIDEDWKYIFSSYSGSQICIECLICFFKIFFATLISNVPIILIFLGGKFAIKKYKKDKLSEVDFKKYKEYYRDVLLKYSPAELSYIDDFQILCPRDVIVTLLSLELKGKINIDKLSVNIEIISNEFTESENENYILRCIKNGKITDFSEYEFFEKIKKDAVNNGLLKEKTLDFKNLVFMFALFPFLVLFLLVIGSIFLRNNVAITYGIVLSFMAILLPFLGIGFLFTYFKWLKDNYIRTTIGESINEKLEGLKNYLKDYSMLNEREDEELALWKDYLIYSVMFGQNKKIIDEYSKFIK